MSESEVSQIRDEDVLRRMWQQTEDFSRKKEIRAHMYRLREERLRNLYSPEPTPDGKGCEFTSAQGHVKSFADQNFQSMKSKEVRDAGSPPKDFAYRGQDLKELSNAGWNVESEDRTTDDGRTHVKSVNANIEGRYDVEGGRGQFAAVDRQRQAITEHHDDHSSLRRDETSSNTAAHEHVVRQLDDGTRFSSTTSSSNTSSKFQQVSSTKHETVPYVTDDDYDQARRTAHDTNRNEQVTRTTNKNDYEQILRKNDSVNAELVARKVEYPDDNTRVIVETRCLPDGTRVTSTRREFRAPAQSTRSEYQTRSESKSYSSQHKSDTKDSTYKTTRHITDNRTNDIVDSQRNVDDHDFKRQLRQYTSKDDNDYSDNQQRNVTKINRKVSDYSQTDNDHSQHHYESRVSNKVVDHSNTKKDEHIQTQHQIIDRRNDHLVDEVNRHHFNTTIRDHDIQHKVFKENCHIDDTEERILNVSREKKDTRNEKRHISRDRLVTEERVTDITRDKPISVETIHDIPKHSFAPTDHDIPRDSRVPEERARDIPRDARVPEERARDIPRDAGVPENRAHDIPRDARVPEDRARDVPKEKVVPDDDAVRVPYRDRNITDERVHKITRDTKVDEVIERKTSSDHYQTTYQNDFQSRKVSTDWSPTHQAWASTLRSDTPSTTRPSTRASSPGSRTFKSSTSSLRSSVSPDKSSRKPTSRGGSPNKVDRYSPTRTVSSDRHSSTQTHSVTEVRTNKNTSPERKPPTGRSSARPGYSPDRKQQDLHRQRPSASPEKKSKNSSDRPSLSPERKPSHKSTPNDKQPREMSPWGERGHPKSSDGPRQSPERKPTYQPSDENSSYTHRQASPYRSTSSPDKKPIDGYPNHTSPRSSPSPDNKLGRQKPTDFPTANIPKAYSPSQPRYPANDAPQKSGTIPDQKLSYLTQPDQPGQKSDRPIDNSISTRSSASPDRKPGYMKPTAASQPDNKTRRPPKPEDELDRKSPSKQVSAQSPERLFHDLNKTIKSKEDHYRFVDEETKTYIYTDKTDINKTATITSTSDKPRPRDKSFSPIRKVPSEDSPGFSKVPLNKTMSPSMKENTTVFTENDEHYKTKTVETTDTLNKQDAYIADITTEKLTPQVEEHPSEKELPNRETSPSKFGTYDKKKPRDITETTEKTIISTEDTKDVKYDSSTRRDKTTSNKLSDVPSPLYQKSPRDSTSPLKSPTKDTKYKHTTEFLASERTTEEVNKKSPSKTHPRQLLTPSTSPTRKPKTIETEPSTGQSSPTTSVSGFVYFGSPRTEKPMVTDLDEFYPDLQNTEKASKRPESLDVKKSPSPSKIPCRSPSPEKHVPVTKDSLPRKSSLKKPSTDQNQSSPLEKPPTSFRVSPTDDKLEAPGGKVVQKNVFSEPETGEPKTSESGTTSKPKPPLQRRETYEDRCKKILGMADDTTTDSLTRGTTKTKKTDSNQSSPSVSPCYSPAAKDTSPFPDYPCTNKVTTTKNNAADFITHEQEDITSKTNDSKKAKILSRESSATKQDNIKKTTLIGDKISKENVERDTKAKNPSTRRSPDKTLSQPPDETSYDSYPDENFPQGVLTNTIKKQPSKSPERKVTSSPSKPSRPTENAPARSLLSPERKLESKFPEENSPSKTTSQKSMGYSKTTTSEISEYDSTYATDFVEESTKTTKSIVDKSQPSRVIEPPSRKTPKILPEQSDNLRTTSPSRSQPKDNSPVRKSVPRDQTVESDHLRDRDLKHEDEHLKDIKRGKTSVSTTTITSKYDSTTENVDEAYMTRIQEKKKPQAKTPSPTRHSPQAAPQGGAPNKTSQPISTSQKRLNTSPQRNLPKDGTAMKTSHEEPKDSLSTKPRDIPGYMKTTAAMNKKFDTTTVSEKIYETNKSRTINSKYDSPGQPDSPSRKSAELKITSDYRASSPTKFTRSSDISPDRKHKPSQQPSSSTKESPLKNSGGKYSAEPLPTRPSPEKNPGYMKTMSSVSSKYNTTEYDSLTTENIQELITSTTIETDYPDPRRSESPTRQNLKSNNGSTSEHLRKSSPSKPSRPSYDTPKEETLTPEQKHEPKHSKSPKNTLGDTKMTTTVTSSFDNSTVESIEENVNSKSIKKKYSSETLGQISSKTGERPRTLSPVKSTDNYRTSTKSPDQKSSPKSPVKDISLPENKNSKHRVPERSSVSPERPGYMKLTASLISKIDNTMIDNTMIQDKQDIHVSKVIKEKSPSLVSTDHQSSECPDYVLRPEEPRQLRTPSPDKKTTKLTEVNTDFLISEREQEIINKVQRSLRKLSPEHKESTPSRERTPNKTTTSLQDLDIITTETTQTDNQTNEDVSEILEEDITRTSKISHPKQPKGEKLVGNKSPNKPSSRNVSPVKKTSSVPTPNKVDKSPESPTKPRSISPKKPGPQVERPQSPQVPKSSGIKPREQIPAHLTRKPTPATLSPTKTDRLTTDVKKTTGVTKQNISIKTSTSKTLNRALPSPTNKTNEPDFKRTQNSKSVKDSVSSKKDAVTRIASDIVMRPKKTSSPQRMKSKPDIQVIDMSTKSPKTQKSIVKEPHSKFPSKPKSATALNTSIDEDDIIIDVQQSKSSRENSPDRICPTPINFCDDVGVPRLPDEVSEPDDELDKRAHHTIHETESVVDDIVEIDEDEELFLKRTEMDGITEYDESLLSVNDKVSKFTNKISSVSKPKDTSTTFNNNEKRVHSDFIDDNLKSDECLLTVSEKVSKFAKGPRDTKDSRSPSRKITDEYDRDTVYQDDYTKLSVNDKAHLFIETAENVKMTKVKPAQKVERPDFTHVDESLKSDNCLLSVSDKVSKFVKTTEQYFTETQEVDETEKKIKEQHEKIMKQIIEDGDDENCNTNEIAYTEETSRLDETSSYHEDRSEPRTKEPKTSQPKVKGLGSPSSKSAERVPAVKITTLRSSEAVKKAKALFENIASTKKSVQKETTSTTKTTKLTDIGVIKKSPKTDSTTVLHPSVEDVFPQVTDVEIEMDTSTNSKERPSSGTLTKPQRPRVHENKPQSSPSRLAAQSPDIPRSKSPIRQSVEETTAKTVLSRYPAVSRAESPKQRIESSRQRAESPRQQRAESPRQLRAESPRQRTESPRYHTESPRQRTESPRLRPESDKLDKVPGYLRPTKTSQIKEETKIVEESEVSSRRGSGKFGVELRRTSIERSTISSERRRSVEHHQPCIEDIYDLDLLEQMLEKVVGYEQRRRIRAQIRVAKQQSEQIVDSNTYTRATKQTTTALKTRSPERTSQSQKTSSPDRHSKSTPNRTTSERPQPKEPTINGHAKEPLRSVTVTKQRPHSPEKPAPKSTLAPKTPGRQPSPDKRRTTSPSKSSPKPKGNRFNEYASAYMKKVGLTELEKVKFADNKPKKTTDAKHTVKHERQQETVQEFSTTRSFTDRTSSKDVIEIVQTNRNRSPSPELRYSPERKVQFPERIEQVPERKALSPERMAQSPVRKAQSPVRKVQSPVRKSLSPERKPQSPELRTHSLERKAQSPDRLHQRTPSPDFKRPKANTIKETVTKTTHDIEKKIPAKPVQEEKPSWVTNRNLKKITSESRTYSSKKIENEKPKYRAPSPSKVISKPIDVITSSYGPGPLGADGKPLFGIKALRNGGSNFQVQGTVIRQEFHSRNGGEPEGTVSVTAYSTQPEELEQLLTSQGGEPPSRIHGLAAITTTKKFGGDTGNTISNIHTKEERASLEQFTHHDRKVEHLESQRYDTSTQEYSEDTRREHISGSTRRIESRKENRQTDRNDRSTRREERVTEAKTERESRGQKVDERREKMEKREDKKTVRQSSVKSLTEKYIKSANDSGKADRTHYPKAGLILRTTTMRDSVSSEEAHPDLVRTDSDHSLGSVDDTVVTTTERTGDGVRTTTTRTSHHHGPTVTTHTRGSTVITHHEPVITTKKTSTVITQEPVITRRVISHEPVVKITQGHQGSTVTTERSFLDSTTKVSGVQDILTRMKNADIVIQEGDSTEDAEARALLNKFLGATVLMAGMQGYVSEQPGGNLLLNQETVRSTSSGGKVTSRTVEELDLDQCWDERLLKKLLDECTDYEQRRRLRTRIRTLMAEQEACASAVTEALGVGSEGGEGSEAREEEEVAVTSSVRRDSSEKTVSCSTTTKTSKVIEMTRSAPKPVSPFAKFRQLEKQNSTNSPNSPKTPQSPGSPSQPYFKFTDPALQSSALTIKERLLQWCRDKTRDYENVKLENFSTSWADGLAFCALVHHFLPDAFDYSKLTADRRRHNFTLAFKVADEKAGIYPLLDVDDMVAMRKPDWKCVFTYVQAIYRRFKDE